MKILQVIPYFNPKKGGDVAVSYQLSKYLSQMGHDVTIITSNNEFDVNYANSLLNVNVIPFDCLINLNKLIITPDMNKWLNNEINTFDIIHLHNFRTYQNSVIQYYAKKYGIPYILQAHGSLPRIIEKKGLKYLFDIFFGYRILRDASKVIALTKTEAEQYKNMGVDENRIKILPNGIDLSEYEKLPDKGIFRMKYGIKGNEKIVLFLGRIHRIKGVDLLVETFSDFANKTENVKLVIAGPDDGFLSTLKGQIEYLQIGNRILFTGPLYGLDKVEAFVDADVYILPSVYETFPNTVLEACACGTPVIVTDRCGISDIVENVGFVVEYDKEQLEDAIIRILNDESLRREFGDNGKKLVRARFGWDKIVRTMEIMYEDTKK
ncbi:1,2-diacylglycerol 3-alpha-glucosyltransferase [Methanosarcinales archaeon]|nr:1,2-diacylglycerol 3-alpha-glucosyltransferase [Methanosarcinales archaeon]